MVLGFVTTLCIGALIIFFAVRNMMGDISSLHSYHRNRVAPEDVKPFGKLVGLGTLIIGIAISVMGVLIFIYEKTGNKLFSVISVVVTIVSLIVGSAIAFYAMKKYNKGIF